MIGRFNLFCRTVNDANKPVGIQKVLMVLFDMNRVKTYGNIGGPVQLQRWVSPPNHCRYLKQTYTLKCDLRTRLINQSALICRNICRRNHIDAQYTLFGSVLSAMIFILLHWYLSCALVMRAQTSLCYTCLYIQCVHKYHSIYRVSQIL